MSEIKTANPRIPSPLTAGMVAVVKNNITQYFLHSVFQNLKHTKKKTIQNTSQIG